MNYHFFKFLAQDKVFVVELHKMVNFLTMWLDFIEIKARMAIILHKRFILSVYDLELYLAISHFRKLHALFDQIDSSFLETDHSSFRIIDFLYDNFSTAHFLFR